MTNDDSTGIRLQAIIKHSGLNQNAFAERIGISQGYLSQMLLDSYIRPAEITRLRFKDFDFERGTVMVHEASAKNGKRRHVTLPASIMPYFLDGRFERMPVAFFVFGAKWVPNPEKHLTRDMMYRRHKEHLLHLRRVGKLADITGLTWYSWKDTGISTHIHLTPPIATRNQAGHHDLDVTLKYYHEPEVNKDYQSLPHTMFE